MKRFSMIFVGVFSLYFFLSVGSLGAGPAFSDLHSIRKRAFISLQKDYQDLHLLSGSSRKMQDMPKCSIGLQYYHEINLKKARQLAVNAIEAFRNSVHKTSLPKDVIGVKIFIYREDKRKVSPKKIGCIKYENGKIKYYRRNSLDQPAYQETYREALKKTTSASKEAVYEKEGIVVADCRTKDGAKIQVFALSLEHSIYRVMGKGFQPYEQMSWVSTSCHESLSTPIKADAEGNIGPISCLPAVVGKSGGICRIDILRKGSPLRVEYPWGDKALYSLSSPTADIIDATTAKDGATARIQPANSMYSVFYVKVEGLQPYETISFIYEFEGQIECKKLQADAAGAFPPITFRPKLSKKSSGMYHIDILRQSGAMHLKLPWAEKEIL